MGVQFGGKMGVPLRQSRFLRDYGSHRDITSTAATWTLKMPPDRPKSPPPPLLSVLHSAPHPHVFDQLAVPRTMHRGHRQPPALSVPIVRVDPRSGWPSFIVAWHTPVLMFSQLICGRCGHGIHAHRDYVSMFVHHCPAMNCAAYYPKVDTLRSWCL